MRASVQIPWSYLPQFLRFYEIQMLPFGREKNFQIELKSGKVGRRSRRQRVLTGRTSGKSAFRASSDVPFVATVDHERLELSLASKAFACFFFRRTEKFSTGHTLFFGVSISTVHNYFSVSFSPLNDGSIGYKMNYFPRGRLRVPWC